MVFVDNDGDSSHKIDKYNNLTNTNVSGYLPGKIFHFVKVVFGYREKGYNQDSWALITLEREMHIIC